MLNYHNNEQCYFVSSRPSPAAANFFQAELAAANFFQADSTIHVNDWMQFWLISGKKYQNNRVKRVPRT